MTAYVSLAIKLQEFLPDCCSFHLGLALKLFGPPPGGYMRALNMAPVWTFASSLDPDLFQCLTAEHPLSSDLLSRLRDARKPDGSTENVGHILADWVSVLHPDVGSLKASEAPLVSTLCLGTAALPLLLHAVLQQPGESQGLAGPEEAGSAGSGLLAALPPVAFQQEAGLVELLGHPPQPPGEIPTAAQRDPEAHPQRPSRPAAPGRGGEESERYTPFCS